MKKSLLFIASLFASLGLFFITPQSAYADINVDQTVVYKNTPTLVHFQINFNSGVQPPGAEVSVISLIRGVNSSDPSGSAFVVDDTHPIIFSQTNCHLDSSSADQLNVSGCDNFDHLDFYVYLSIDRAMEFRYLPREGRQSVEINLFALPNIITSITPYSTTGGVNGDTLGPDGNIWFTEFFTNKIGRITPDGTITEFPMPNDCISQCNLVGITLGSDNNFWITDYNRNKIARMTPDGQVSEYPLPTDCGSSPHGCEPGIIKLGGDGNVWFTEFNGNNIGRITPDGIITEFPLPSDCSSQFFGNCPISGLVLGPDNNLWFTEGNNSVGRVTPDGTITEFPIPNCPTTQSGCGPAYMTVGPDNNLWFTENSDNKITKITLDGNFTKYSLPEDCELNYTVPCSPTSIHSGPDGNIWFSEPNRLSRLTLDGTVTEYDNPEPANFVIGSDNKLWYSDANGFEKITFPLTIANNAPVLDVLPAVKLTSSMYSANGSFIDPDSTSWTATVDYGDGGGLQPLALSGENYSLNHTYNTQGTHIVTVNVTDNQGLSDRMRTTVIIGQSNHVPSVGTVTVTPNPVNINSSTSVSASFTDADTSDTHIATINWGDGSATQSATVTESSGSGTVTKTHTYTSVGSYTVTVKVTDSAGGSSTRTKTVSVIPALGLALGNINGANYSGANLSGQNMSLIQARGTNFTGANLSGANLTLSNASGANFTNANLTNTNFTLANVRNANFTGADLTGAQTAGVIWSNTICPNGTNSNTHNNTCRGQGGGL